MLNQLSQISAALIAGVLAGLSFDIYQRLCYMGKKKHRKPRAYIKGDIIFTLTLIALLLMFWFTLTNGSLRWSVFVWLAIGMALYLALFRYRLEGLFAKLKLQRKAKKEEAEPQIKQARKNPLNTSWQAGYCQPRSLYFACRI